MIKTADDFRSKFKIKELKIYETDYWIWSLRPVQVTIGSGVLSLKRECSTFSELNQQEFYDLNKVIKVIESTIKKAFNYDIMNYLMLMMVDKQVHYHVIPRYGEKVVFDGKDWVDTLWPSAPNLVGKELNMDTLKVLTKEIKSNIKL